MLVRPRSFGGSLPTARRVWPAAVLLASIAPLAHAAAPPQPICSRNEVLDVVAGSIAQRGVATRIIPSSVGEIPTASPDLFRCSVRVQTTFYDTNRYGTVPQVRLSILQFTVRAGRNGLFVDDVGDLR